MLKNYTIAVGRIIGLFSFALVLLTPQVSSALTVFTFGSGTPSDPYRVRTCAELRGVLDPGATLIMSLMLVSDLDCTGVDFDGGPTTLIGNFFGDGHTISNLNLNQYSIFNIIQNGTVNNLKLEGTIGSTTGSGMGSLANRTESVTIENVHSTVTMDNPGTASGGLVGNAIDTTFNNVSYRGDITSLGGGGIVGLAQNVEITDAYTSGVMGGNQNGGVVGRESASVVVTNTISNMSVEGTNAGGVVGPFADYVTVNESMFIGPLEPFTGSNLIGPYATNVTSINNYLLNLAGGGNCIGDNATSIVNINCVVEEIAYSDSDVNTTWGATPKTYWTTGAVNTPPTLSSFNNFENNGTIPNSGDANDDGVEDRYQFNVMPIPGPDDDWTTVEIPDDSNCSLYDSEGGWVDANYYKTDTGFIRVTSNMVGFNIYCKDAGATVTVTLVYDRLFTESGMVLRHYNSTTNTYSAVNSAIFSTRSVDGETVTTITYNITDGGLFDTDGSANRIIRDPVGVAKIDPNYVAPSGNGSLASTGSSASSIYYGIILSLTFGFILTTSALRLNKSGRHI